MPTSSSTADRSSKRKRNGDVGSGDRRSVRRISGDSATSSSKLTSAEILGSCCSDKNKYITRKENNKTLQVTFTCNDTNETFDSLAAAGEHFLEHEQKVQWMEDGLADDELVQEALISLSRGGNRDAIRICEEYDIDIEDDEEEGVGMPVKSTKKEEEDDAEDDDDADDEDNSPFGLSKAGYVSASLDMEKEKSKMEMGALLSHNNKRVIVHYLGIVVPMENKLTELNATTTEEINGLNEQIKNDSPHKEKKRIKAAIDKKKAEKKCRTSYHKKQVNALVKDLKETFVAIGFELPKHLEEEYADELEEHADLRKIFFPPTKKGKKSKKAKA